MAPYNGGGVIFVISAPSGVGKSTLAKAIVCRDKSFVHPVSYTTRIARPGEKDGDDYRYVTPKKFERLAKSGYFLEKAFVHGAHYATPKREVERRLKEGKHVLFAIDVQGARSIVRIFKDRCIRIFLLPPNRNTWLARLRKRQEAQWAERMAHAKIELAQMPSYDYCMVNGELDKAINDFFAIARAEELRPAKFGGAQWLNGDRRTKKLSSA